VRLKNFQLNVVKDGNKIPVTIGTKDNQDMRIQILSMRKGATVVAMNITCQVTPTGLQIVAERLDDADLGKKTGEWKWNFEK